MAAFGVLFILSREFSLSEEGNYSFGNCSWFVLLSLGSFLCFSEKALKTIPQPWPCSMSFIRLVFSSILSVSGCQRNFKLDMAG